MSILSNMFGFISLFFVFSFCLHSVPTIITTSTLQKMFRCWEKSLRRDDIHVGNYRYFLFFQGDLGQGGVSDMRGRNIRNQVISVLIICSFIVGIITPAVSAGQIAVEYEESKKEPAERYHLDSIYIFFDKNDEIMKTIVDIVTEIVSFKLESIVMIPVDTYSDFSYQLSDEPWIAVYAFQSNLTHVQFPDISITWQQFYKSLAQHQSTHHIIGMANTLSMEEYIIDDIPDIIDSQAEQTDALLLAVHDIWSITDVIESRADEDEKYKSASEDLRSIALTLFADNFNEIFSRTLEPVDVVGQIDQVALEERTQEMWAEHAPTIEPAVYKKLDNGTLVEIPKDQIPEDFSPVIKLSSAITPPGSDFSLGKIPLFSGLRGPIGEIVNVLLKLLSDSDSVDISIDSDTMDSIRTIFEIIQPFIGIVSNYDSSSPMKSIIQALANEFPFIEEYKVYIEVLLKCLFSLRGSPSEIIGTVTEAVISLLPELFPGEITDFVVDLLGVNNGLADVLTDVVDGGKGVFDSLLAFFTNNVLTSLFNKTLVATFGLAQSTADVLLPRMSAFSQSIINFISTLDFETFVNDVAEELLTDSLGLMTDADGEEVLARIMSVVKLSLTVLDAVDSFTIESVVSVVAQLVVEFFGAPALLDDPEDIARGMMGIVKDYMEGSVTNVAGFRDELESVVTPSITGFASPLGDLLIDVITMIAGFYNDGFSPSAVPDMFEVFEGLVDEMGFTPSVHDDIIGAINGVLRPVLGIIAEVSNSDSLREMVSKTLSEFDTEIGNIPGLVVDVISYLDLEGTLDAIVGASDVLDSLAKISTGIIKIAEAAQGKSFEGVMHGILISVAAITGVMPAFDDVPIDAFLELLKAFFPEVFGIEREDAPMPSQVIANVTTIVGGYLGLEFDTGMLNEFLKSLMDTKDIFTKGVRWLTGMLFDWLTGELTPLFKDLTDMIEEALGNSGEILGYHSKIPIGVGDWNLFDLTIDLGLIADFEIDPTPLFDIVRSVIFDGREVFSLDSLTDFFGVLFKCFSISPRFYADMGVEEFDTSKNPMLKFLLESFGLELTFSGHAHFVLNLFTFRGGVFEWDQFMRVFEWGFNIKIGVSRTFTFLDFITGGAAGALNAIGEYIGLDAITVTVFFAVELDIVKRAATAIAPEVSTLTIAIALGATAHIGLDLLICELAIDGTIEIILTFFQDLASSSPMQITLNLIFTISVTVDLLLVSKDFDFEILNKLWDLSPHKGEDEYANSGIGFDTDGDGLGDEYEATLPGYDLNNPDTDGDGAGDKLEVQTMFTDGTNPDTDGDGLLDGEEWELGTNPHFVDSDWDDITDFEEVRVYGTNPLCMDTDGDGLNDDYEIYTKWNITTVTPTVTEVIIGGVAYNDHTDPLNPDTDGDSLLDGDEGPMGAYYGLSLLYNETASDPDPLIFNNGYTHPLDADTDDDSYLQLYNGVVDSQALLFLKDMNDGAEVHGLLAVFYDDDGIPEEKRLFTNPCNPDSDGDTGITDRTPQASLWINSDGFELAQDPPTNPLDADSDGDGLIDGIEGILSPTSSHTNPNMADTDGDGLFDMHELLLGCDPRSTDTDGDLITDGDEFYIFFTNPLIEDTDFDALKDGEEVFLWHSNPLIDDSDGDGIRDGDEVLLYGSDPMDEDGDNDGLTDFQEIMIYYTDPFSFDTDLDGLGDGAEIFTYNCDPLSWDTDGDSITEPNEFGEMTWPMSDYDEVMIHHTNATATDSDLDGLSDAIELYVGAGEIPWMDPIQLDPMNADTDGDNLTDGCEMMLVNYTAITYPYIAVSIVFVHSTSPVLSDTDGDLLTDYQEIVTFKTDASNVDTDNDTISDWWEVWVYNTSAINADTDGDNLPDINETLTEVWPYGPWPPAGSPTEPGQFSMATEHPGAVLASAEYLTSATDPDSDDDWLPDGAEVQFYMTNPMDADSDHDGTNDGLEFDTDFDGLLDAYEFSLGLQYVVGGGIMNPDSDGDGLLDGAEVNIYHTDPLNRDSDGDGIPDGFEVATGSDPLFWTYFSVLAPVGTYVPTVPIQFEALNYTAFDSMWYRYGDGLSWSSNVSLTYSAVSGRWEDASVSLPIGVYLFEIFGEDVNGTERTYSGSFTVSEEGSAVSIGSRMVIMTPVNGGVTYSSTAVRVQNLTSFESMWYRYKTSGPWSDNITLTYSNDSLHWSDVSAEWPPGEYVLQVFGEIADGTEFMAEITFTVPAPFPWLIVIGVAAAALFGLTLITYRFWWMKRGTKSEKSPDTPPDPGTTEEKPTPKRKRKTPVTQEEPTQVKTKPSTKKSTGTSSKKKATTAEEGGK